MKAGTGKTRRGFPAPLISAPGAPWTYLVVTILIVLPLLLAIVFERQIYAAYLRTFVAPRLEREFGYRGGRTAIPSTRYTGEFFVIMDVAPGGVLQKAGVEPGDIPIGYNHGFETGFLGDLMAAEKGRTVELKLTRPPDLSRRKTARIAGR